MTQACQESIRWPYNWRSRLNIAKSFLLIVGVWIIPLSHQTSAADPPPCTDKLVTWLQYDDPSIIDHYNEVIWPESIQQPWLRALDVPESDLRREAADTVSLAVRVGLKPLADFEKGLLAIAIDPDELPATRLSATGALIACGYKTAAPELMAALNAAPFELAIMIETALIDWQYQPMEKIWLQRLSDFTVDTQLFNTAVSGVAALNVTDSVPVLKRIVMSQDLPVTRRLAAADAWAKIAVASGEGLGDLLGTGQQLRDSAPTERSPQLLLSARLLPIVPGDSSESQQAITLLEQLADHPWNVIRGDALKKLLKLKPDAVISRAKENISFPDTNVRSVTVDSLALDKSQRSVVLLGKALNDPAPMIRRAARDHLLTFASDNQWTETVLAEANGILGGKSWQGLEQCLIIITRLEHREARSRIAELAEHPRPEVYVTAAWSLKTLAEKDWAPQLFDLLQKRLSRVEQTYHPQDGYAVAHLMESMGVLGYRESLVTLSKCFPKAAPYSVRARCAAIWAAGFLAEEDNSEELEKIFVGRMMDFSSIPPEDPEVRAISAVSLGRMKASGSLEELRDRAQAEGREGVVGARAYWAVSQITGEPMPDVPTLTRTIGGWSLQPAAPVSK